MALCAVALTGCDFIRWVAGRPSSSQLEKMRVEKLRRDELRHQARLDSMRAVQKQMADSLAALEGFLLDSLSSQKGAMFTPERFGGLEASTITTKYCIVVGAFRESGNAERMLHKCTALGYAAAIIRFRNGLSAVAVCQEDNLTKAVRNLNEIRSGGVLPEGSWLFINKEKTP